MLLTNAHVGITDSSIVGYDVMDINDVITYISGFYNIHIFINYLFICLSYKLKTL